MSQRAVFLDRDGVINEEMGYLNHLDRLRMLPGSGEAIRLLNQHGWKVVVITNQAGVAKGFFPEALIGVVHTEIQRRLQRAGARLDAIYYCPHHPDFGVPPYRQACACRKPQSGMLRQAASELDLDLAGSYLISDRYRDLTMTGELGATGILVLTGYGKGEEAWCKPTRGTAAAHVAENLFAAVRWLLERESASVATSRKGTIRTSP